MEEHNKIPAQIELATNYLTNRLARSFRLEPSDKDNVRQELTLKALIIIKNFEEGEASLLTYTKQCLQNKALDIARKFQRMPPQTNSDDALAAMDIQQQYTYSADRRKNYVPFTVSMGGQLQHISACDHEYHLPLKMDIEAILPTLSHRQRKILEMLEDDVTQEKIAKTTGIEQQRISEEIQQIRIIFQKLQ